MADNGRVNIRVWLYPTAPGMAWLSRAGQPAAGSADVVVFGDTALFEVCSVPPHVFGRQALH